MKSTSLIFAFVIVVPLIFALYSIVLKDKQKGKIGAIVIGITFIVAIIISYYVNKDK
jgi:hypothetical protein